MHQLFTRRLLVTCGASLAFATSTFSDERDGIDYETAHLERRLTAQRASSAIVVDGVLDEPDWAEAPVAAGFIQNDPNEGNEATYDTEVRVLYDQDNLYFGVTAHDEEPAEILINDLRRDYPTGMGDNFGIVLDTFHDRRNGFMFQTNPAGAKFDAQFVNEGREFNTSWDGVWHVRSRVTEIGWTTEIAIPFKTLRYQAVDSQTWGVNFLRKNRRLNEDSHWAPLPRFRDVTRVSLAGTLEGIEGLNASRDIKVTPYALGDVTESAGVDATGDFDAGLDAKLGVGKGLTLDLTLNTDFSQVEADVQQVNLTRFSLFFPEKRDFFLENSGIFRFGPPADPNFQLFSQSFGSLLNPGNLRGGQSRGDDLLLFFSRRIGLSEQGEPIPVVGGGRLTGRVGAYEMGFLNIQTGEATDLINGGALAANGDNFTVARVRRNIFANSDIGVMFINRENMGTDHFNRAIGVDANFRITQEMDVNAYLTKTSTRDREGDDLAGRLAWAYEGRLWQLRTAISTLQDNFNPEVGFAPRIGVKRSSTFFGYHYRQPWAKKWIREINPHGELEYFNNQQDVVVSRYFNLHLGFFLENGGYFEFGRDQNLEQPMDPFVITPEVTISPGFYTFTNWFAMLFSDTSRMLSGNVRVQTGDFYSGTLDSVTLGGALRLGDRLTLQAGWSYNDIDVREGSDVVHLVSTRVLYSFSTNMFLNALIQFNNVTQQWSSNIRFNLIHRPLSDFFIVYNDRRDDTGRRVDQALIAKYTYLFSF